MCAVGPRELEVRALIVVFGTDLAGVAQPVAVIGPVVLSAIGRTDPHRVGEKPSLATVRPVLGLQPMGLSEPAHGGLGMTLAVQVLAELEAGRGLCDLGRARPGATNHLNG